MNKLTKEEKDSFINTIVNLQSFRKIMVYRHGEDYENDMKAFLGKITPDEALKALIAQARGIWL